MLKEVDWTGLSQVTKSALGSISILILLKPPGSPSLYLSRTTECKRKVALATNFSEIVDTSKLRKDDAFLKPVSTVR